MSLAKTKGRNTQMRHAPCPSAPTEGVTPDDTMTLSSELRVYATIET